MKTRLSAFCTAAVVAVFMAGSPSVKAETVTLQYLGATSNPTVTVKIAGTNYTGTPTGPFYWQENELPPNTSFPPPTVTFCIEIGAGAQPLPQVGSNTVFDVMSPATAPTINSAAKAQLIGNLFAKHYDTGWNTPPLTAPESTASVAFQLALWEIIYELPANALNLSANNFQAPGTYAAKTLAQGWLDNINSNVPAFNFEIVALVAPSTTSKQQDLVQDQITFRPRGVVPAPPGVILAGVGFLALAGRSRWLRRKPTA